MHGDPAGRGVATQLVREPGLADAGLAGDQEHGAASRRRVVQASRQLARFVLAGSVAAAGPSRTPRREDEPLAPVEPYGASKAEAERIALSYADRLPVTVARPPRIMGPGDRENLFFFRLARAGVAIGFRGPERPDAAR